MHCLKLAIMTIILVLASSALIVAGIPHLINYQGHVAGATGAPLDTTIDMTFYLYEADVGGDPIWTETHPDVAIVDGLFEVRLGAYAALDFSMLNGVVRYVGMKLGDGPVSSSRVALVSVAYAFRSGTADTAAYAFVAPGSGASGWVDDGDAVRLESAGDKVGIGTASPGFKLEVVSGATGDGMRVTSSDGSQLFRVRQNSDGSCETQISNDAGSQTIVLRGGGNCTFNAGNVGIGTTSPSERLVVGDDMGSYAGEMISIGNVSAGSYSGVTAGEDTDNRGWMVWKNDNNQLVLGTKDNAQSYDNTIVVAGGKVGIGSAPSYTRLYVNDDGTAIFGENEGSTGGAGVFGKSSNPLGQGINGLAMATDGKGVIGKADGASGHGVHAVAVGTSGIALYAEVSGNATKAISANADVTNGVALEARGGAGGMAAKFYGNVNLYSRVDNGLIMELGEGLDYAEGFDMSGPHQAAPGTVVIIDPDHPGQLTVSTSPYDTRVAGIVAGARGLESGVRLGSGRFEHNVALAGRVYCNVDATDEAIEPGDLLTTSSTPGHAMKASEYSRAQGAILGKAMEKMEKGRKGQILVLVTLQ